MLLLQEATKEANKAAAQAAQALKKAEKEAKVFVVIRHMSLQEGLSLSSSLHLTMPPAQRWLISPKPCPKASSLVPNGCTHLQAAQRGQKAAIVTTADPDDPLKDM